MNNIDICQSCSTGSCIGCSFDDTNVETCEICGGGKTLDNGGC